MPVKLWMLRVNNFTLSTPLLLALIGSIIFLLVNLFAYKLRLTTKKRKASALSFFGGVAAAYVFLDLLPSLRQAGNLLRNVTGGEQLVSVYEDAIFFIVFVGFLIFFILEHLAVGSRRKQQQATNQAFEVTAGSRRVFAVHLANFCFLNAILSFVLFFEYNNHPITGIIYTFAVSLHLLISNDSMIDHYKHYQLRFGRFIAAGVPILGWALSVLFPERLAEAYVLLALISGVILYHSIKNEVPSALQEQSLKLFIVGAVVYTVILLVHALIIA